MTIKIVISLLLILFFEDKHFLTSFLVRLFSPSFYIIDGKIITDIKEFGLPKPADIENISVLRGESAVSVYGEKARDGVIIITTKK